MYAHLALLAGIHLVRARRARRCDARLIRAVQSRLRGGIAGVRGGAAELPRGEERLLGAFVNLLEPFAAAHAPLFLVETPVSLFAILRVDLAAAVCGVVAFRHGRGE